MPKKLVKTTAYKASDGKLFENETQANQHEVLLELQPEINSFKLSEFCNFNSKVIDNAVADVITAWETWKVSKLKNS